MRERSIRFRLTAWYALVLFGALCLFSGLIWLSLRQRLLGEVDQDLADRAARFQSYVTREAAELPPVRLKDELEEFCQALPPIGPPGASRRARLRVPLSGSGVFERCAHSFLPAGIQDRE